MALMKAMAKTITKTHHRWVTDRNVSLEFFFFFCQNPEPNGQVTSNRFLLTFFLFAHLRSYINKNISAFRDTHFKAHPFFSFSLFFPFFFFHLVNTSSYLDQMATKFLTRKAVILLTPLSLLLKSHLETQNTSYFIYLWKIDGAWLTSRTV